MLVITLGDPHSVSCEILADLLASDLLISACRSLPVLVIGSFWQWHDQTIKLKKNPLKFQMTDVLTAPRDPGLYFFDIGTVEFEVPAEKLSTLARGRLMCLTLEAIKKIKSEKLAVLTCPIDKKAAETAGFSFPGQTEYFESIWQGRAIMILAGPRLRVGLVTNHLSLSKVTKNISKELVSEKIDLFLRTLSSMFGIKTPHLAVCGLNPHLGDKGLFGNEDERIVAPAVREAAVLFPGGVSGPFAADTVFHRAYHGEFDGVLAMYHDQGLGPLKTVHFHEAINISGGLCHLRVSPGHGPAADLFLKGQSSPASFQAALKMAIGYLVPQNGTGH